MPLLPSYSSTAVFCEAVSDLSTSAGDDWQAGLWFSLAPFTLTKVQGCLFMLSRERLALPEADPSWQSEQS